MRLVDVLSVRYWAVMWSTYAPLDPAYVDTVSFGYNIDVGNGVTQLLPSILFAVGMTAHGMLPARIFGMFGLVCFYQMWYGAVVYFFQYFNNRRHVGHPGWHVAVVVVANVIWMVFPSLGMWACSRLIRDDSYSVFL